jgi:hypothetical protein
MGKFRRIDTFAAQSSKVEVTPEGFWMVEGTAAVVGAMTYTDAEGAEHTEYVSSDVLKAAAQGLIGRPVVLEHPAEGEVNSQNFKMHTIGTVLESWFDEEAQENRVRVVINDLDAQNMIDRGIVGLSPGYLAGVEEAPEDVDADYIQTSRVYNHLAVVENARGGEKARLHLDSKGHVTMGIRKDACGPKKDGADEEKEDAKMTLDEALKMIDELQGQLDALMAATVEKEDEMSSDPEDGEEKEDEYEKEDAEQKMDSASFARMYAAHRRALEVAGAYGIAVSEETPTAEIQKAVVASQVKSMRNDSAAYVEAAFDILAERAPRLNSVEHLAQSFRYDGVASRPSDEIKLMDPLDAYRNRNRSNN